MILGLPIRRMTKLRTTMTIFLLSRLDTNQVLWVMMKTDRCLKTQRHVVTRRKSGSTVETPIVGSTQFSRRMERFNRNFSNQQTRLVMMVMVIRLKRRICMVLLSRIYNKYKSGWNVHVILTRRKNVNVSVPSTRRNALKAKRTVPVVTMPLLFWLRVKIWTQMMTILLLLHRRLLVMMTVQVVTATAVIVVMTIATMTMIAKLVLFNNVKILLCL
mmetsp:Transcript_49415/g.119868  ORF Transcript_49415/g.119868 Transcript_49415/m.119868 type:complete len:216 (+) Transcript_49415:1833-2480(+)